MKKLILYSLALVCSIAFSGPEKLKDTSYYILVGKRAIFDSSKKKHLDINEFFPLVSLVKKDDACKNLQRWWNFNLMFKLPPTHVHQSERYQLIAEGPLWLYFGITSNQKIGDLFVLYAIGLAASHLKQKVCYFSQQYRNSM